MNKRSTFRRYATESRDGVNRCRKLSGMDLGDAGRTTVAWAVTSRYRGMISNAHVFRINKSQNNWWQSIFLFAGVLFFYHKFSENMGGTTITSSLAEAGNGVFFIYRKVLL